MNKLERRLHGYAKWLLVVIALAGSQPLLAGWVLDESGSHLGFASVKNESIAENHHFTGLSGGVSDEGQASVIINLASVETLIPLRNERMRDMLFDVASYPLAVVTAQVDMEALAALEVGEQHQASVEYSISLHGISQKARAETSVVRSGEESYLVSSLGSLMINADDYQLAKGVNALREIAGLAAIDLMVPITFNLSFIKQD